MLIIYLFLAVNFKLMINSENELEQLVPLKLKKPALRIHVLFVINAQQNLIK